MFAWWRGTWRAMRVCIVIDALLPPVQYGGTERVAVWLGRALHELGHRVCYLAHAGSRLDFAPVLAWNRATPLHTQIPADTDIVHSHSGLPEDFGLSACQTIHGNTSEARRFHPNSIFVSESHARNHGATAFVHHGMDPRGYAQPDFAARGGPFVFLAKAAWKVKNLTGAIRTARLAGAPLEVLGGHRLNFKMGFRLTLDPNTHFHGMVDDHVKSRWLRGARGLLLPVRWPEPFGIATIESLYFGVPVFGTPYGSLPELIGPEAGSLAVCADELAEAARRADRFDRRALHAYWAARFTAERMARKYVMYYEKILAGEPLHSGVVESPSVRGSTLLPWRN